MHRTRENTADRRRPTPVGQNIWRLQLLLLNRTRECIHAIQPIFEISWRTNKQQFCRQTAFN